MLTHSPTVPSGQRGGPHRLGPEFLNRPPCLGPKLNKLPCPWISVCPGLNTKSKGKGVLGGAFKPTVFVFVGSCPSWFVCTPHIPCRLPTLYPWSAAWGTLESTHPGAHQPAHRPAGAHLTAPSFKSRALNQQRASPWGLQVRRICSGLLGP